MNQQETMREKTRRYDSKFATVVPEMVEAWHRGRDEYGSWKRYSVVLDIGDNTIPQAITVGKFGKRVGKEILGDLLERVPYPVIMEACVALELHPSELIPPDPSRTRRSGKRGAKPPQITNAPKQVKEVSQDDQLELPIKLAVNSRQVLASMAAKYETAIIDLKKKVLALRRAIMALDSVEQ